MAQSWSADPCPGTVPASTAASKIRGALARTLAILKGDGEREQTQRNAVTAFGVRCASAALLYISQIVLARWMGSYEYGIYVFVWTWVLVLGGLSDLGLSVTSIRLIPRYREAGDTALVRGLVRGARGVALGVGTLIAVLGIAGLWLVEPFDSHYVLPAYLALVCVPLYALTAVQDGIGKGFGWMAVSLTPPYIVRPALLLLAMVAAHEMGLPDGGEDGRRGCDRRHLGDGPGAGARHQSPGRRHRRPRQAHVRARHVDLGGDAAARHGRAASSRCRAPTCSSSRTTSRRPTSRSTSPRRRP